MNTEIEEILRQMCVRDLSPKSITTRNVIIESPFKWPIAIKYIKSIVVDQNTADVSLKHDQNVEVSTPCKGLIIAIDKANKMVAIEHIVAGGACYITVIHGIEISKNLHVGKIVVNQEVIGIASEKFNLSIIQPNVKTKPNLIILFPALPALTKIVAKMDIKNEYAMPVESMSPSEQIEIIIKEI